MTSPAVLFFGELGCGNIGNDGSFSVLLDQIREDFPGVRVAAIGYGPEAIQTTYGVKTTQMNWIPKTQFQFGPARIAQKAILRFLDPIRSWRQVRGFDVVVVPGAGVLEGDLGTKPFGLPFALFRIALAARARKIPLALVGVGASPTDRSLSRFFFAAAVRMASFRSFRDKYSRNVVSGWVAAAARDQVFPDLAFGVPLPEGEMLSRSRSRLVAVGVMAYRGVLSNPETEADVLNKYITELGDFVGHLLAGGWQVRLVTGDAADVSVVEAITRRFKERGTIEHYEVSVLEDVAAAMSPARVVVATRFHNVLMSVRMRKPTIAAGYSQKNFELLEQVGLGHYYVRADEVDAKILVSLFQELLESEDGPLAVEIEALRRGASDQRAAVNAFIQEAA